tara:strand:+ start:128 stop:574 length:447 start_codon:yes stop_codon:yes gene_type:complete
MKYYNYPCLIIIALLLSSCIGPLYNPYPISKLIARVGPPLKINSMSVEEQINAEINAENEENVNDDNNTLTEESNTNTGVEEEDKIDLEVIDEKTIIASWLLDIKENLILPPKEVVNAVNEKCLNGNRAQLITFSSSEGKASATFKCW